MKATTFTLPGCDETPLFVRQWLPNKKADIRAVVQLAHGLAEHSGRYEHVAEALTARGYVVIANDHRGHGKTVQAPTELGHYADDNGWNLVIDDLYAVNRWIKREFPALPLLFVGHSMGSFMGQEYLIRYSRSVDACVLSATSGEVGLKNKAGLVAAKVGRVRVGKRGHSPILDRMSFGEFNKAFKPTRTESDWLSRDEAEVDKYIADPLCGFGASSQLWIDLLTGIEEASKPARIRKVRKDLPVYLITGMVDASNQGLKGVGKLAEAYQREGIVFVEIKGYPGGRHEMFNETNRDEVIEDMLIWMDKVLARHT